MTFATLAMPYYLVLLTMGICALTGVYAYLIYPVILKFIGSVRRMDTSWSDLASWPALTVTVCAYNEEAVIAGTLDQLLDLDYPKDRIHVVVVSDASTDRTDEIVQSYAERENVELVRQPTRRGKTAAEGAARDHVRGEIVVFADATVRIPRSAVKRLVSAFSDSGIGVASGRDVSVESEESSDNQGESAYVGYEMWLRELETRAGGIVGASGCFFACRKEILDEALPDELSRDFATPLIARELGYRAVSVNDAVCFVPRGASLKQEYRRKVRTMARGLATLAHKRHLMNPFKYGQFAWMLFSHKLARWLVPLTAMLAGLSVIILAFAEPRVGLALCAAIGVLAVAGGAGSAFSGLRVLRRLATMPAYLAASTGAGVHAWTRYLMNKKSPYWEPTRRAAPPSKIQHRSQ